MPLAQKTGTSPWGSVLALHYCTQSREWPTDSLPTGNCRCQKGVYFCKEKHFLTFSIFRHFLTDDSRLVTEGFSWNPLSLSLHSKNCTHCRCFYFQTYRHPTSEHVVPLRRREMVRDRDESMAFVSTMWKFRGAHATLHTLTWTFFHLQSITKHPTSWFYVTWLNATLTHPILDGAAFPYFKHQRSSLAIPSITLDQLSESEHICHDLDIQFAKCNRKWRFLQCKKLNKWIIK